MSIAKVAVKVMSLVVCLMCAAGCSGEAAVTMTSVPAPAVATVADKWVEPSSSAETLEYFGETWSRGEPVREIPRRGNIFTCEDPTIRLIVLDQTILENQFRTIVKQQVTLDGETWLDHGPERQWWVSGQRSEGENFLGEPNGFRREWYADGTLRMRRRYVAGKQHGLNQMWNEDGSKFVNQLYEKGEWIQNRDVE